MPSLASLRTFSFRLSGQHRLDRYLNSNKLHRTFDLLQISGAIQLTMRKFLVVAQSRSGLTWWKLQCRVHKFEIHISSTASCLEISVPLLTILMVYNAL